MAMGRYHPALILAGICDAGAVLARAEYAVCVCRLYPACHLGHPVGHQWCHGWGDVAANGMATDSRKLRHARSGLPGGKISFRGGREHPLLIIGGISSLPAISGGRMWPRQFFFKVTVLAADFL